MYSQGDENIRECVDCGYSDVMEKNPSLAGKAPVTRVSPEDEKPEEVKKDDGVQIVRILGKQP